MPYDRKRQAALRAGERSASGMPSRIRACATHRRASRTSRASAPRTPKGHPPAPRCARRGTWRTTRPLREGFELGGCEVLALDWLHRGPHRSRIVGRSTDEATVLTLPPQILMHATPIPATARPLAALLDEQAGRYRSLNGARHLGEYLARTAPTRGRGAPDRADPGARSSSECSASRPTPTSRSSAAVGLKPDFTPIDLVAHRFVLDAKSSTAAISAITSDRSAPTSTSAGSTSACSSTCASCGSIGAAMSGHDPELSFCC